MPAVDYRNAEGKKLPSVTTVNKFKDPEHLMRWANRQGLDGVTLEESRRKTADPGSLVHIWVDNYLHFRDRHAWVDDFFEEKRCTKAEREEIERLAGAPYQAFQRWAKEYKPKLIETELSLVVDEVTVNLPGGEHSITVGYGGTLDFVGTVHGELCLMDWKTSSRVYADHMSQLQAYRYLWEHGRMNVNQPGPITTRPDNLGEKIQRTHVLVISRENGNFQHYAMSDLEMLKGWYDFVGSLIKHHCQKKRSGLQPATDDSGGDHPQQT